jgi:RNA polymerase sigma-70 factor, ECF subfamily
LAERFEENRTHLKVMAYRILGSLGEADDAVQGAWLRLSRADTRGFHNLGGWLDHIGPQDLPRHSAVPWSAA